MKSLVSLICLILAFSVMAVHGSEANDHQDEWESGEEAGEDTMLKNEVLPGSCWACKRILNEVKKSLTSTDDSKNIAVKLSKICDKIDKKIVKTICRKIVSKSAALLVKLFTKHEDVRTMCVKIKFCKPKYNWEITN